MRQRRTRRGWLPRLVCLWRPDRNPLRRTADRVEAAVIAVLIAVFLGGAPLAALTAGRAAAAGSASTGHPPASRHQVAAVLLRKAPARAHPMFQVALRALVPARWTAPDGTSRTGQIYAPEGAQAGSIVAVWTDGSGRLTRSPSHWSDELGDIALAASLAAAAAVAAVLALAGLLTRWVLDRR